ncbi:hypothetical protein SAMN05443247_06378 [Bradyrhizobium erythrophlei]|nr:hypothetical protein SAMN05443247_06378 [Bradyrhizobium erythrophlei]
MASTTTNNGATVDNLNVLDALTSDNLAGAQIIELQDIAYALFPSTNATQTLTIDSAFWTGNLRLTFHVGSKYFTLWGVSEGNFDLVQSDAYGTALNSAPLVTFSASSASSFLSAFLTNVNLVATGLTSTSLLTALDIIGGVGKNVFQATISGQIVNIFTYASANDSFNGTGSQWDVINNFNEGVDKLDFRQLIKDSTIVASQGGHTAFDAGLGELIWKGLQPANTTNLGATGAYAVWYTTDGNGGSFVYADTNGDGIADLKIDVSGVCTLTANDFIGVDPPAAFTVTINPIEPTQFNQWLVNAADAHAGVTVTGTTTHVAAGPNVTIGLNGHTYTATVLANGTWSANISAGDLLAISDGTYTLSATVKVGAATLASSSHSITVDETPPAVSWAASTPGVEGTPIHLGTLVASDGDGVASLVVSGAAAGAILSDGINSHTFSGPSDGFDIHTWNLSSLRITTTNDTNFNLSALATDFNGNSNAAVIESVTVNPLAPTITTAPVAGNEDTAIALNISATVNSLSGANGDGSHNSLQSLVISAIPIGATLSDGTVGHNFTAITGHTSVDVNGWTLSNLKITPPAEFEGNFSLSVMAAEKDAEGDFSSTATTTEVVTVNPVPEAPVLAGTDAVAVSSSVNEDGTVALTITPHFEVDPDASNTITISGLPASASLSNGSGPLTPVAGVYTLTVAQLAGLTLHAPDGDLASISMNVQAHAHEGSTTADSAIQTITVAVNPVPEAPVLAGTDAVAVSSSVNEDGTVALTITPHFEVDPDASNTITISGLPAGASLSNGIGPLTPVAGVYTLTVAQLAGLTLHAPDGDLASISMNVQAHAHEGVSTADSAIQTIAVTVTPVADAPTLTAPALASGNEDAPIALNITDVLSEIDGDASLTNVTITGVPAGVSFSAGTLVGGTLTLTPAELSGLTLTSDGEVQNFSLHVVAGTTDAGSPAANASTDIAVTVTPVADAPTLTAPALASGNEDAPIALNITDVLSEIDGDASLTNVTITGVPAGVSFSAGTLVGGTLTLTPAELSGLTLTSDGEVQNFSLHVVAGTTDAGSPAANASTDIAVTVTPVADAPTLTAPALASGNEDAPIALNITDVLSEIDGDASLTNVTITGVPAGVSFSAGTLVGGTLTLTPAELSGLTLTSDGEVQNFSLHVVAGTTDAGSPAANASTDIAVTVTPVADAPTLTAPALASGNEDAPIALNITDVLSEIDGDASLTNVTITGVPAGVSFSAGTLVGGTLTLTPAELSGLTLTSDGEVQNFSLHVVAGTTDAGSPAANASTDIAVTVTPVADAPTLTAPALASGNEDAPIALNITDVLSEIDGDASLTNVTITGVPAGVSFSAGTLVGGTLTLTPAELSGLTLTSDGEVQNFSLHVVAGTTDAGSPAANASTDIAVTVTPVADAPTLTGTQTAVTVNEDGSAALTIADALTEIDADSHLGTITISGVPAGVTFNNGSAGVGNTWTLNPATDLTNLQINVSGDQPNFTLSVVATTNDGGNIASSTPTNIAVNVNPAAENPTLGEGAGTITVTENAATALGLTLSAFDADDSLSVTITGVPSGATFNAGTLVGSTLTISAAQLTTLGGLANLKITTADAGGTLSISANNAEGGSASENLTVNVNPAAENPTLGEGAGTITVTENAATALGLTLSAFDADDSLSVTITGVPSGATFNAGTLVGSTLTISAAQLTTLGGLANLKITTADAGGTLSITANNAEGGSASENLTVSVNPAAENPTLGEGAGTITVTENAATALGLTLSAFDADDSLSVTITGVPSGATFNAGTLVGSTLTISAAQLTTLGGLANLKITTADAGGTLSITANNAEGGSASENLTVSVNPAAENPTLGEGAGTITVTENAATALGLTLSAFDADDSLSVTITGVPSGATFNAGTLVGSTLTISAAQLTTLGGLANLKITTADAGGTLSITANNAEGGSASENLTVNVNPAAENPTLGEGAGTITVSENAATALGLTLSAFDADDSLSVTITGVPTGATFNAGTLVGSTLTISAAQLTTLGGLANLKITTADAGGTLAITATNSEGGSASENLTVSVNPAAENPSLGEGNSSITVTENAATALGLTLSAFDADDSLSVTITGVPSGATFNAGTLVGSTLTISAAQLTTLGGLANLTITTADAGGTLAITATNSEGGSASENLTVNVNPAAENPTLGEGAGTITVTENAATALGLTLSAFDADDSLSVTITGVPSGATFNAGTLVGSTLTISAAQLTTLGGLANLKITTADAGGTLAITATNSEGGSASENLTVSVNPAAENPSLGEGNSSITVTENAATALGLTLSAFDADDSLSVTITGVPSGATFNAGTLVGSTLTISAAQLTTLGGLANLKITTADAGGTLAITATNSEGGTASENLTVNVTQVLDASNTVPGTQTATEGVGKAIAGISISDADATGNVTTTLSVPNGTLTVLTNVSGGLTAGGVSGNGTGTVVLTGSVSAINATLAAANGLTYLVHTDQASETLTVATQDQGTTGPLTATSTVTINVAAAGTITITTANKNSTTVSGSFTDSVNVNSITVTDNGSTITGGTMTINNTNHTWSLTGFPSSEKLHPTDLLVATATDASSNILTSPTFTVSSPAGIAGSPINLALSDPSGEQGRQVSITVSGVPSDWSLNAGTNLGNGTWTVQTNDPSALSVTTPASYAGAMVLNVAESWTNADGSTGIADIADNVEAYAPGSPIFAVSSNDTLTGAGGNDEFVFSQLIGNDVIYSFNVASDKIDLIGFNNVASFSDIQANLTDDANGNAMITIGSGETITLNGVDAASLTASDFAFNQTLVTQNASSMVISDGAILPLSGVVNNTGTIALNSTGDETDLELIQHGITLQGGGGLTLSDSGANAIFGTDPGVTFTNVDNTISGAGQLGEGQMTLVNEGTIDATGNNPLVVDTGSNIITNSGILEATGTGGLIVNSGVANSGCLLADGGNLTFNGAVTGNGSATISGAATFEFAAASAENVSFAAGSTGTLKLDDSASFTGSVSGLTTTTYIDLADLSWAEGQMVASFVGDASGGRLTVSDGTHSDTINLAGDYTHSSWTLSQDSNGNTLVVDPPLASAPNASGPGDKFTMLMAQYAAAGFQSGVGGGAAGYTTTPLPEAVFGEPPPLTKPT